MKNPILLLAVSSVFVFGCEPKTVEPEKKSEPKTTQTKEVESATPKKGLATTFTLAGIGKLKVGDAVDKTILSDAFGTEEIIRTEETAEGEVLGEMFEIEHDGKRVALAYLTDKEDRLESIEVFGPLVGPEGVTPGVSTFEKIAGKLEAKNCLGGLEARGEQVFCDTKFKNMQIVFESTVDTMGNSLDTEKAAKALAGKKVHSVWIGN